MGNVLLYMSKVSRDLLETYILTYSTFRRKEISAKFIDIIRYHTRRFINNLYINEHQYYVLRT